MLHFPVVVWFIFFLCCFMCFQTIWRCNVHIPFVMMTANIVCLIRSSSIIHCIISNIGYFAKFHLWLLFHSWIVIAHLFFLDVNGEMFLHVVGTFRIRHVVRVN
uniref:Uncharacterized protein n=1 Tax=Panstrongylus lignarius TaxID=156445 RepID=A0A224Y2V5_9HEMI